MRSFAAAVVLALTLAGCYAYPYYPAPGPDPVEVSFNAAQGALQDAGLTITMADRGSGTLRGKAGNAEGTIRVNRRSDGGVGVQIDGSDAGLTDRLTQA